MYYAADITKFILISSALESTICTSLLEAWNKMNPLPVGILDQLYQNSEPMIKLTASIYLPQQSRLVVGREDGSIIIVPATQTVMLHLLHGNHQQFSGQYLVDGDRDAGSLCS